MSEVVKPVEVNPLRGYFAVAMPTGNIWPATICYLARDSRAVMGDIFIGWRVAGRKIETSEEGWACALKQGYRVVKVDVFPAMLSAAKATP